MSSMTEERKRYLLKDAVDLHIHTGPSIARRSTDIIEMTIDAVAYDYRAFVAKDHYFPTIMSTALANKHFAGGKDIAQATMVMNNSVGGYNLKAVTTAIEMGSKYISMPTVSTAEHQGFNLRPGVEPFKGSGNSLIKEVPIPFVGDDGNVVPEAVAVMEFLTKNYPDVVFATGHGSALEVDAVIKKAFEVGIKKIHVNHPYFIIDASIDMMAKWASWGAYIELNANLILPASRARHAVVNLEELKEMIRKITPKQSLLVTDMGQFGNIPPTDAMAQFMEMVIVDAGIGEDDTFVMAKENPIKLLGL